MENVVKIRPRRGTRTAWETANPILLEGELGFEYDDSGLLNGNLRFKMGDGIHNWNDLPYGVDENQASTFNGGNAFSSYTLQIRHDTTDNWIAADPVLAIGEIVFDDTKQALKVGNGIDNFSDLRYIGSEWKRDVVYDFGNFDIHE